MGNTEGTTNATINRLYVAPLQIPFTVTIDKVIVMIVGAPSGNIIAGIYDDGGSDPSGEARLAVSGTVALVQYKNEIDIGSLELTPGLYWTALIFSATDAFRRSQTEIFRSGQGIVCGINNVGSLTIANPCPAMTMGNNLNPTTGVRVLSVP